MLFIRLNFENSAFYLAPPPLNKRKAQYTKFNEGSWLGNTYNSSSENYQHFATTNPINVSCVLMYSKTGAYGGIPANYSYKWSAIDCGQKSFAYVCKKRETL